MPSITLAQETGYSDEAANSCIIFARVISPYQPRWAPTANDLGPLQPFPEAGVGSWVVFKPSKQYGVLGHAAIIIRLSTSTFDVVEANYKKGQIGVRTILIKDNLIKGYYP